MKPQNKWWDGYLGETTIVLDDLDLNGGQHLGHYLKIWADKYPFTCECKGGRVQPEYDEFIVTSNYSIRDVFGKNEESEQLVTAIERRFKVIYFEENEWDIHH